MNNTLKTPMISVKEILLNKKKSKIKSKTIMHKLHNLFDRFGKIKINII